MTSDEPMRILAELALSEARRELEQRGSLSVLVNMRMPDGKIESVRLPDPLNELMNSGEGKDLFFGVLRKIREKTGATAVLIATDAWMGWPTEKQMEILKEEGGPEKLKAMVKGKSLSEAEAMGLVERKEALAITVQTETEVLIVNQFYERDERARRIFWGQRDEMTSSQDNFDGRQKMYGKEYTY